MIRKLLLIISILVISILLLTGCAGTRDKISGWKPSFQPATYGYQVPEWNRQWFYYIYAIEPFKNNLYVTVSGELGPQVFRSPDGVTWEAVSEPGFGYKHQELYPAHFMTWDMIAFQDRLYVPVNDWGYWGEPGKVMRSENGTDWVPVFEPVTQDLRVGLPDKLGIFDGMLYLTTVSQPPSRVPTLVWRSPSGDPGTWEEVGDLGDNVWSTSSPTVFKEHVYISGHSKERGVLLWRSADGKSWELVDVGVPKDENNYMDGNLVVFKGQLYLSSCEKVYGGHIYRSKNGIDWEKVVDGFDQPGKNGDISTIFVYKNKLYAGVYDLLCNCTLIFRSSTGNPKDWQEVNMQGWPAKGASPARNAQAIFNDNLYFANSYNFGNLYRTSDQK